MSDKRRERGLLDAWLAAARLPVDAVTPCEAPDFVLRIGAAAVGVEVTEFVGAAGDADGGTRAQASLREQVLDRAHALYRDAGGAPLHVDVTFRDDVRLEKRSAAPLARDLAVFLRASTRRIMRYDHPGAWRDAFDARLAEFLPGVQSVQAVRVPDEGCACWAADAGGWLRHAGEGDLRRTVAAKEGRLPRYRARVRAWAGDACAEQWLLIIFDLYAAGDPVRAPRAPVDFSVVTAFDRVTCYDRTTNRAVDIPRRPPHLVP